MTNRMPGFDFGDFKYVPRLYINLSSTAFGLVSPMLRERKGLWTWPTSPTLKELIHCIGLTSESHNKVVAIHQKRYTAYLITNFFISALLYLFLLSIFFLILAFTLYFAGALDSVNPIVVFFFWSIWFFSMMLALYIADRIASTLLDGFYADTLAFVTCLFLLFEIHQADALLLPTQRGIALKRVRALHKMLSLLAYRFSSGAIAPNRLAVDLFGNMTAFIEEIEYQILAPTAKTRQALEKELWGFVQILLTEQYGEFEYKRKIPAAEAELLPNRSSRLQRGALRLFGGIILPLFFIIGLGIYSDQLGVIESQLGLVVLICFSWLLLGIDTNLNLGFVERITGLAKTMKDLK